jgi:transcriptional regulator with XRE-family HTH domain
MSTRGERIRQALEARGIKKQQALAAALNVHESSITRWKDDAAMSLESAVALGTALDVSLDWLLLGRGTIDSHRHTTEPKQMSGSAHDGGRWKFPGQVGPGSIALLVSAIEAIVDDVSSNSNG